MVNRECDRPVKEARIFHITENQIDLVRNINPVDEILIFLAGSPINRNIFCKCFIIAAYNKEQDCYNVHESIIMLVQCSGNQIRLAFSF